MIKRMNKINKIRNMCKDKKYTLVSERDMDDGEIYWRIYNKTDDVYFTIRDLYFLFDVFEAVFKEKSTTKENYNGK